MTAPLSSEIEIHEKKLNELGVKTPFLLLGFVLHLTRPAADGLC